MTNHHTISQLESLRLHGMAQALQRQQDVADIHTLSFEDRLGLMIEHEIAVRASVQLTSRLRHASLRQSASVADIDFRKSRGLSKSMIMSLAGGQWISQHQNILITGATGVGKSFRHVPWHTAPVSMATLRATTGCRDFLNKCTLPGPTVRFYVC